MSPLVLEEPVKFPNSSETDFDATADAGTRLRLSPKALEALRQWKISEKRIDWPLCSVGDLVWVDSRYISYDKFPNQVYSYKGLGLILRRDFLVYSSSPLKKEVSRGWCYLIRPILKGTRGFEPFYLKSDSLLESIPSSRVPNDVKKV